MSLKRTDTSSEWAIKHHGSDWYVGKSSDKYRQRFDLIKWDKPDNNDNKEVNQDA